MAFIETATGLFLPEDLAVDVRRDQVVEEIWRADFLRVVYACPLYGSGSNPERRLDWYPELVGTATAVEHDGRRLLVTAAHVLKDDRKCDRELLLLAGEEPEPLPPTWRYSSRDPDDFAVLELDAELAAKLTGTCFYGLEGAVASPPGNVRSTTFVGYPCSWNKPEFRLRRIRPEPVTVWATKTAPQLPGWLDATFDRRSAKYSDGRRGCPDLHGISGGAIWEHAVNYEGVVTKLIGITVEHENNILRGHDLRYILRGVDQHRRTMSFSTEVQ